MTQIQALESMSQPDLVNLIKFERQQHADDMDMLSKELASRKRTAPEGQAVVEALNDLLGAAHPSYIQDEHFRNKLIKARDKAFKALEKNRLEPSMPCDITPADAVYGLLAWLTCREEVVALSARHGAAIACDLAKAFCEENGLLEFSDGYPNNLKYPDSSLEQEA